MYSVDHNNSFQISFYSNEIERRRSKLPTGCRQKKVNNERELNGFELCEQKIAG